MSEVTGMLDALAAGKLTTEQVAAEFAARKWPAPRRPADRVLADESFPPEPAGSFAEVAAAYSAGTIDAEQYRALAVAAAKGGGHA